MMKHTPLVRVDVAQVTRDHTLEGCLVVVTPFVFWETNRQIDLGSHFLFEEIIFVEEDDEGQTSCRSEMVQDLPQRFPLLGFTIDGIWAC